MRRPVIISLILTAVFSAAACFVSPWAGLSVLVPSLLICAVFAVYTRERYKKLGEMADCADKILHGNTETDFSDYCEGELAVLGNELQKMTLRLREQADDLANDKKHLSDSMADISHQLKTPLTSVNLLTELLTESALSDERQLELTRELARLTGRIERLVSSLLKLSKIDAGSIRFRQECVEVKTLADEAFMPLAVLFELKGVEYTCSCPDGTAFTGDLHESAEALTNILKNCLEHTPEGGAVTFAAEETALYTELTVSDTGCGIAPEDLSHIFERFYKGADAGSGSVGIGLALARSVFTAQNGTVKAENNVSGGAKFTVRFYKFAV